MSLINDIYILDEIFSIEQKARLKYGLPIPNVSHWDSSPAFQRSMAQALSLPQSSFLWDYYYTYSIPKDDRLQVLKQLGVKPQNLTSAMGLFLQSSTIAIVNMINLLVQYHYKKLCILQPSYFSVESCCNALSLPYGKEWISFAENRPKIPADEILSGGYDCVWITSPIFCTSYYYDDDCLHTINLLREAGLTLILDESLALPGRELIRTFQPSQDLFAIYSPHKAISINGMKFAVIVSDIVYEDFLEQWVDILSGALGSSNRDAIFHYISSNYLENCYTAYETYINYAKEAISEILKKFPLASMLPDTIGHYINIFVGIKNIDQSMILDIISDVVDHTFASFIPSSLNGFDMRQSLSFRINLTGDITETRGAVGRILDYLSRCYH